LYKSGSSKSPRSDSKISAAYQVFVAAYRSVPVAIAHFAPITKKKMAFKEFNGKRVYLAL
jgi:hypothetical protein